MATPGGGAAGAPTNPPPGPRDNMAGQPQQALVEIAVSEYLDDSDPQHPFKVCNILITTRNDEEKKKAVKARVQITSNGSVSETDTSDNPATPGVLRPAAITLRPDDRDVVYRVDNMTYGGSVQVILKAPPKPETHEHFGPEPGTWRAGVNKWRKR